MAALIDAKFLGEELSGLERIGPVLAAGLILREPNVIDERISHIIQRPMTAGHAGEWIASRIFDIKLELSATAAACDGRFRLVPLQARP